MDIKMETIEDIEYDWEYIEIPDLLLNDNRTMEKQIQKQIQKQKQLEEKLLMEEEELAIIEDLFMPKTEDIPMTIELHIPELIKDPDITNQQQLKEEKQQLKQEQEKLKQEKEQLNQKIKKYNEQNQNKNKEKKQNDKKIKEIFGEAKVDKYEELYGYIEERI